VTNTSATTAISAKRKVLLLCMQLTCPLRISIYYSFASP
jgi:hypothetical protein